MSVYTQIESLPLKTQIREFVNKPAEPIKQKNPLHTSTTMYVRTLRHDLKVNLGNLKMGTLLKVEEVVIVAFLNIFDHATQNFVSLPSF